MLRSPTRSPSHGFVALLLAATAPVLACGVFEELQSEDSAEGTEDGEGSEGDDDVVLPDDGSCLFPDDSRCRDQDTIDRCNPETEEIEIHDCHSLCGGNTNFSCIMVSEGEHGCWCVEPGPQKVFSCTELEDCLADCTTSTGACPDQCFARTTASTVRMFGALVNCAHTDCQQVCLDNPGSCASCVEIGIRDGAGACGLHRSVCDADENDELGPFG